MKQKYTIGHNISRQSGMSLSFIQERFTTGRSLLHTRYLNTPGTFCPAGHPSSTPSGTRAIVPEDDTIQETNLLYQHRNDSRKNSRHEGARATGIRVKTFGTQKTTKKKTTLWPVVWSPFGIHISVQIVIIFPARAGRKYNPCLILTQDNKLLLYSRPWEPIDHPSTVSEKMF